MPDDNKQNPDTNVPLNPTLTDDSGMAGQPSTPSTSSDQATPSVVGNQLPTTPVSVTGSQPNDNKVDELENAPSNEDTNPEAVITSPHAPKKYGGKKIIATIFGVVLLTIGVTAGVLLIQRQQELREQAASGSACSHDPDCELLDNPGNSGTRSFDRTITHIIISAGTEYFQFNTPGGNDGCYDVSIGNNSFQWNRIGSGSSCKDISNIQVWFGAPQNTPTTTPTPTSSITTTPTSSPTGTPTGTITITPTGPPTITAECSEVKAYNTSWVQLTQEQLNNLGPGNAVRFTVSGSASEGTFDKARFSINGTQRDPVTTKKPGSDEFYDQYVIPEGVTSFSVEAQVHHSSLGWF